MYRKIFYYYSLNCQANSSLRYYKFNFDYCFSLGCYNKYHKLDGLNNTYFSQVWRLGVQDQDAIMTGYWRRTSSWLVNATFLLYPHMAERALLSSFPYKGTNPIMGGSTLMNSSKPKNLLKAIPPNIITFGIRASKYGFLWGRKHSIHRSDPSIAVNYSLIEVFKDLKAKI